MPEEFVCAYMSAAANDDDISTGKDMMKRYGIKLMPPRFRQDNRSFYIDKKNHTITDALNTMKGVGLKDAEALWTLADGFYFTFVDVLVDITNNITGALNKTVMENLIKVGYFEEFGKSAKLWAIYDEFYNGKNRITKSLKPDTIVKRLDALYEFESSVEDKDIPVAEQIAVDVKCFGAPQHIYPEQKMCYVVLDVDSKYSPKLKLYSLATGNIGVMKTKKDTYKARPVANGDIIGINGFRKAPQYKYIGGERIAIPNTTEYWINSYEIINKGDK